MSDSRTQSRDTEPQAEAQAQQQPRAFPPSGQRAHETTGRESESTATSTTSSTSSAPTSTTTPTTDPDSHRRRGDEAVDEESATHTTRTDQPVRDARAAHDERVAREDRVLREERAEEVRRERFGGYNTGADFFGWLVAIALSVLLASIVGAIVTAVSINLQVDQTDAERRAGSIGLATAITLLVILMIGYYAGGYVAGRMSRFDGGKQGLGVWIIGLVVTIAAVAVGAAFGSQYNILDRVDLPSIPIPRDTLTGGGILAAAAILVGTLLAALVGGKVGQRYHRKVDRTGY